jgi:pyruvate/2-oxoglutarate dehydrogenase complex dihydrolipoamide dehydrogenase (E3) component
MIATGAKPIIPNLPGVDANHVYSVEQVLKGEIDLKNSTVAVIGSGLTGLETAELLQVDGNKTLIVEMQDAIAPSAYMQNVLDVRSRLAEDKTEYLTSHQLIAIDEKNIKLKQTKTEEEVIKPVDAVVLSIGYKPNELLIDSFNDAAPVVKVIGDAKEVKNIGKAIRSGYQAAYSI